jgi:predicted nucleic acid-binding protein
VLVDTGPLVALFEPEDPFHDKARATLVGLRATPLASCEAVITEASHLLRSTARRTALQTWIGLGHVEVRGVLREGRAELAVAMAKYADLPMDYADAVLVHLATAGQITRIWTYDRRDFSVYRVRGRRLRMIE